jgi:hypothetical protein
VFTRPRNTFSPLASTLAMHRSRFSCRSNADLRALCSGFTRSSDRRCVVEDSSPPFCFFADRRLARDIQRTRSATHHILWCLVLGASDDAVSFAGTVIQHAVDATSTRAAAAEFESADRPEKTAAEPAATATVASATAAASAAASAGRSSGNGAGALPATARTAAARRGREPGRVATAQRGARPRLERCERDQRLAEAAVRVGEAEEVVEQALRERGPAPQPAQRLPHLRVVEQLRERDEHARDLRRGGRHGRRDGGDRPSTRRREGWPSGRGTPPACRSRSPGPSSRWASAPGTRWCGGTQPSWLRPEPMVVFRCVCGWWCLKGGGSSWDLDWERPRKACAQCRMAAAS